MAWPPPLREAKPREAPDNWNTGAVDAEKATALPLRVATHSSSGTGLTNNKRAQALSVAIRDRGSIGRGGYAFKAAWHPTDPRGEGKSGFCRSR